MKHTATAVVLGMILVLTGFTGTGRADPSHVAVEKNAQGHWQLLVDGEPYFIKGFVYSPVKIGEDPGRATLRDWMYYDDDANGENDVAYQTWLDADRDARQDPDEKAKGDFALMRDMGANTIRLYHVASDHPDLGDIYKVDPGIKVQYDHPVNQPLLRKLDREFGIKVIMGHFLGSWTIGSGAGWDEGTDYTNPVHRENIKKSVKAMVLDNKDEPYVLFWALGNENNMADWSRCNAKQHPKIYAKFVNELAEMIHALDPHHPVAVIDGEDGYATLKQYARHAPAVDILAYNTYRQEVPLQMFLKEIRAIWDRPVYLSETGWYAYRNGAEEQDKQKQMIKGSWRTLVRASAAYANQPLAIKGTGNAIGVTYYDWLDRWYMDGRPEAHNEGNRVWPGTDVRIHEEWFGVMSMGDGSDPLMRQPRQAYDYLKEVWPREEAGF
jgi:beta-glucuronidase